jgi:hypothetical protein
MSLVETEQPQPKYKNENTANKIVQVPNSLLQKHVDDFEELISEEVVNLTMGQSILYEN